MRSNLFLWAAECGYTPFPSIFSNHAFASKPLAKLLSYRGEDESAAGGVEVLHANLLFHGLPYRTSAFASSQR